MDISIDIINNGTATAGNSTVAYYLSTDANIETNDYLIGTDAVGTLPVNGSSNETIVIDVATITPPIPADSYYVGFFIDYTDVVAESDEGDNQWYWPSPKVGLSTQAPCPDPLEPNDLASQAYQIGTSTSFSEANLCIDPAGGRGLVPVYLSG